MSTLKTLLTAAALGATAYSRILGQRVSAAGRPGVERGTFRRDRPSSAWPPPGIAPCVSIAALTGALAAASPDAWRRHSTSSTGGRPPSASDGRPVPSSDQGPDTVLRGIP